MVIIKHIKKPTEKAAIAKLILSNLPEWFGIPESTADYIEKSQNMPFIASFIDDKAVGFVVLKQTSQDTAEIFVMGVLKAFHRQGIGGKLYAEFESMAKTLGYSYIQVKTVQFGKYNEYDITNHFYQAVGFKALECFPDMWDKANPCQIHVKFIG